MDAGREERRLGPRPAQDAAHVGHHGEADVAVDADLGERALAQGALDGAAVSGVGEAQQFLVAVGEVVVLVVGDHLHRAAEVGVVGEVLAQQLHLLGGALFGDPAVGEVGDDVLDGERLVALELVVGQADAVAFQQHRVVGLRGHRDGLQTALLQQGVEDPAVLVLVGAVPGDLGCEVPLRVGHERRDAGVLPAALGLPAGRDRAEQREGLVVVEDLLEQALRRQHGAHLSAASGSAVRMSTAPQGRVKCGGGGTATGGADNCADRRTCGTAGGHGGGVRGVRGA